MKSSSTLGIDKVTDQCGDLVCRRRRNSQFVELAHIHSRVINGLRCRPASHRQNHPELCVAAHHSGVSLRRFFEWIGFNHGAHAG
jgi:hypothetical protein